MSVSTPKIVRQSNKLRGFFWKEPRTVGIHTKSEQVIRTLRTSILSQKWKAGERLPTEYELVDQLGVSRATVRDALNVLSREGLIVRKPGSGTHVSKYTFLGSIGIFVRAENLASPAGYYHRAILDATRKCVEADGFRGVPTLAHGVTTDEVVAANPVLDLPFDSNLLGVIGDWNMGSIEDQLLKKGVPSVTIDAILPAGRYCVIHDYLTAYNIAVSYLKDAGHDDFAVMYTEAPADSFSAHIHRARMLMLKEIVGYDATRLVPVKFSNNFEHAMQAFSEWWNGPNRKSAIFITDDAICEIGCYAMLTHGISVPDDISVVTISNRGKSFPFPTHLTSIEFDPAEAAASAWNMLRSLITSKEVEIPVVYVKPKLNEGDSVRRR